MAQARRHRVSCDMPFFYLAYTCNPSVVIRRASGAHTCIIPRTAFLMRKAERGFQLQPQGSADKGPRELVNDRKPRQAHSRNRRQPTSNSTTKKRVLAIGMSGPSETYVEARAYAYALTRARRLAQIGKAPGPAVLAVFSTRCWTPLEPDARLDALAIANEAINFVPV